MCKCRFPALFGTRITFGNFKIEIEVRSLKVTLLKNTSPHQRAMRRISPSNPVRRRLFPEAHLEEEARMDNCANVLQETLARDQAIMTKKYNFDFATETVLPGDWEWSSRDGENWIGTKANTNIVKQQMEKDCVEMKQENETTPKEKPEEKLPVVRKRKSDAGASDSGARRKISFD